MRLPHLTEDLPGTGGRLRDEPEDFRVEELPLYEPVGLGEHAYLRVEKRGITTHEAADRIARATGVRVSGVGYAGLKDARAVAVQTFSVERADPERAAAALGGVPGLRVLDARAHRNKLRLGHLRGNRFQILLRDVVPDAASRARGVLSRLEALGCPNWFGEQRFGLRNDNQEIGRRLVAGDAAGAVDRILGGSGDAGGPFAEARALFAAGDLEGAAAALPHRFRAERRLLGELVRGRPPEQALRALPRPLLRLYVSAFQSELFNRVLAGRLPDLGRLEAGDLAWLHDRGAVFLVEDPAVEQPRADAFEVSPTGPLFGRKMIRPSGAPGAREEALLEAEGLAPDSFRVPGVGAFEGARRPLRVPLADVTVADVPPETPDGERALLLGFALPRGSYATAVLHEVTKA